MPVVSCPSCQAKVQIEDQDLGYDVECPYCRKIFPARPSSAPSSRRPPTEPDDTAPYAFGDEPMKPKMPRRPSGSRYDEEDDDEEDRYDNRPRRRKPKHDDDDYRTDEELIDDAKDKLRWPGIFSVLAGILALCYHALDIAFILTNPQALNNNPFGGGGPPPPLGLVIGIKVFVFACICTSLAASFAMMRLKSRNLVMVGMVLQIIPCAGPCCVLGAPFAIWALIAMSKPDVKEAFELVRDGS